MSDQIIKFLIARLKQLMDERGVKAAPLAKSADLNESTVLDVLRGRSKNPGIVTLSKIASVLKVSTASLVDASVPFSFGGKVIERGGIPTIDRENQGDLEHFPLTPAHILRR